jgi:hypothetical protein
MTEKVYKNPAYAVGTECNSGTRETRVAVTLKVDGEELELVPFVENLVANVTLAVVRELEGYKEGAKIEITLN